jgi:ABC-type phosphate transport system substrate-binding protein
MRTLAAVWTGSVVGLFTAQTAAALECGPANGKIAIAGSARIAPIARAWANAYRMQCNTVNITVREGGNDDGAARVCAMSTKSPADIGNMDRYVMIRCTRVLQYHRLEAHAT